MKSRSRVASNTVRTILLFAVLWAVLLGIGAILAHTTGSMVWLWVMGGVSLIGTFFTYWNSASLALRQMNAEPMDQSMYPEVYRIVEDLSRQADQPMPTLWIAPTMAPNAFATGRNPKNAAVCVTAGILDLLNERELRGVIGHELSHVYNRDILITAIASSLAGIMAIAGRSLLWMGGGSRRNRDGGGAAGLILSLVAAIVAPLIGMLIQLAISRTREYEADHDGAILSHDPLALASALKKLEVGTSRVPLERTPEHQGAAQMMIANPFSGESVRSLMSTHPPMEERIRRLEELAGY